MLSLKSVLFVLAAVNLQQTAWAVPAIGEACVNECVGGATCLDRRCSCPRMTIETPDKQRCLPEAQFLGGGCELQQQCTQTLTDLAICLDNKCTCKENAVAVNNRCEKKRDLGERCDMKAQCQHINNADCINMICSCDAQYVPHPKTSFVCLPIAVSSSSICLEDIQCSRGLGDGAHCPEPNSTCRCMEGSHISQSFSARCIANRGLDEECNKDECYLPLDGDHQNIECINQKCSCKNEVTPSQNRQSCSGSAGLRGLGFLSSVWLLVLAMTRVVV